ncbi:Ceramide-1-phosphate transfer protein [Phytophthora nicotianae]|uniref:Ceramide-1-phosphate transfer protein n=1 Tax=Phytophthora nicotianae TaxID=4792 RepID=A0A0W8DJR4_PHYNI|nr:Ceramide-1-phosphate transfer protein [Phytophthora nicotianae]
MHETLHNFQDNGVPMSLKKTAWLLFEETVQHHILLLPLRQHKQGKKRKTKTVAGRWLTRKVLQQPDEPSQAKISKRTRNPAKSKRPKEKKTTARDQRQEQKCKQEQDIHQEQEHEEELVLGQEEQQAELLTTQSSHNDPVLFVANF